MAIAAHLSISGIITTAPAEDATLVDFKLMQNYPNPFNPSTRIAFSVPSSGFVSLRVYDVLGREVTTLVNEVKQAGSYKVVFNAEGLASGVYFYRLQAGEFIQTKRMLLLR